MFGILDAADGNISGSRPKSSADRACDQCKQRKVKCQMTKPCLNCTHKGFQCSYDTPRRKRGPAGKRISEIRLHQSNLATTQPEVPSPPGDPVMADLHRVTTAQSDDNSHAFSDGYTQEPWSATTASQPDSNLYNPRVYPEMAYLTQQSSHPQQTLTSQTDLSASMSEGSAIIASPSAHLFPSLPAESPTGVPNPFVAILEQELPPIPEATDVWPRTVNEATLLHWIDVYFKRLHPTIPILNRTNLYGDMLLRKHRTDPQYGAMLLGLCAFAMTQPVQIHERASMPSRSVQGRMLMEQCVKMRVAADFGEDPSIEVILASFFLFACLFGSSQHKAARHRLREAVDLAYSLGLHLPSSYELLSAELREQWLRTYLVLSVTERAYALQQNHAICFRGQPGITARFMQAFDPNIISSLIYQDQSDAVGMTGLLYLMDTFDAINESVMDCWNGFCKYSDGACESFDRRRAVQTFHAQRRVREACVAGNISFAPSVAPLPLAQLVESQQADISVTQYWLLNRLWNLCLSHQLLREASEHQELRFDFACHIAHACLAYCNKLALAAMEVHGVGLVEKIYDIANGVITALAASAHMSYDTVLAPVDSEAIPGSSSLPGGSVTVQTLLEGLGRLIGDFRGGDHQYVTKFAGALNSLPAYQRGTSG